MIPWGVVPDEEVMVGGGVPAWRRSPAAAASRTGRCARSATGIMQPGPDRSAGTGLTAGPADALPPWHSARPDPSPLAERSPACYAGNRPCGGKKRHFRRLRPCPPRHRPCFLISLNLRRRSSAHGVHALQPARRPAAQPPPELLGLAAAQLGRAAAPAPRADGHRVISRPVGPRGVGGHSATAGPYRSGRSRPAD